LTHYRAGIPVRDKKSGVVTKLRGAFLDYETLFKYLFDAYTQKVIDKKDWELGANQTLDWLNEGRKEKLRFQLPSVTWSELELYGGDKTFSDYVASYTSVTRGMTERLYTPAQAKVDRRVKSTDVEKAENSSKKKPDTRTAVFGVFEWRWDPPANTYKLVPVIGEEKSGTVYSSLDAYLREQLQQQAAEEKLLTKDDVFAASSLVTLTSTGVLAVQAPGTPVAVSTLAIEQAGVVAPVMARVPAKGGGRVAVLQAPPRKTAPKKAPTIQPEPQPAAQKSVFEEWEEKAREQEQALMRAQDRVEVLAEGKVPSSSLQGSTSSSEEAAQAWKEALGLGPDSPLHRAVAVAVGANAAAPAGTRVCTTPPPPRACCSTDTAPRAASGGVCPAASSGSGDTSGRKRAPDIADPPQKQSPPKRRVRVSCK
jgi:hypothetical protein